MEYLSWLFFCLSPFALFCSEDGNGLILCPIFIILGFVFKWIGNNNSTPTAVVKVEPQKFWEWHYIDAIHKGRSDSEAREWATTICGYHNAWVPSEGKQEQIARANNIVTDKMKYNEGQLVNSQKEGYMIICLDKDGRLIEDKTKVITLN